jgi:hypothetical protein
MKVALAPSYRIRMFALLPATLGLGTAVLWARSLRWPRSIDGDGLTLGYRKVPWRSIERIGVWRDYCHGEVSQIDIHHDGSVDKVPVRSLQDGQMIASTILALFKETRRSRHIGTESVGYIRRNPH